MGNSKQTEEHVAYHEAGHFVAAYVLGFHEETEVVTIVPDANKKSAGENRRYGLGLRGDEPRERVESRVVMLYAGRSAELRFDASRQKEAASLRHDSCPVLRLPRASRNSTARLGAPSSITTKPKRSRKSAKHVSQIQRYPSSVCHPARALSPSTCSESFRLQNSQ